MIVTLFYQLSDKNITTEKKNLLLTNFKTNKIYILSAQIKKSQASFPPNSQQIR